MRRTTDCYRILYFILLVSLCFSLFWVIPAGARDTYGKRLCSEEGFYCVRIEGKKLTRVRTANKKKVWNVWQYTITDLNTGEVTELAQRPTWDTLWPDPREREIVQKINRMNIKIRRGMTLAVPVNMDGKTYMDFLPFPKAIESPREKVVIWDPNELAWAAYNEEGILERWGPGVGGANYCRDVGRGCRTVVGQFNILYKGTVYTRSRKYPIGCSGRKCAPMPYFMPFHHQGYGFHGSPNVPGVNASHGCVRMFTTDAKWLNQQFADRGTKVIVRPYAR